MEQIVQIKLEANSSAFLNCIFVSNFSVHCEISFVCSWKKNLSLKRLFPFKSHFAEKNLIKKDVCTNTLLLWLWFLKKTLKKLTSDFDILPLRRIMWSNSILHHTFTVFKKQLFVFAFIFYWEYLKLRK